MSPFAPALPEQIELVREAVRDKKFAKPHKLAKKLPLSPTQIGRALRDLGWEYWGSSTRTRRTWYNPKKDLQKEV